MLVGLKLLQVAAKLREPFLAGAIGAACCKGFDEGDEETLQFDAAVISQHDDSLYDPRGFSFGV